MQNKKSVLDILGPVMIGPSSSHTAGAVRLGKLSGEIFGQTIKSVVFNLYNSFAKTGFGHGTQNAILAGILGFNVDDVKIKDSFNIAKKSGLNFEFNYFDDYTRHPNSVDITMKNNELEMTVKGASVGAGEVVIQDINGFSFNIRGEYDTLVLMYKDAPGMIYRVASLIQSKNINIASMNCDRSARGKNASMGICLDSKLPLSVYEKIKQIDDMYIIRLVRKLDC